MQPGTPGMYNSHHSTPDRRVRMATAQAAETTGTTTTNNRLLSFPSHQQKQVQQQQPHERFLPPVDEDDEFGRILMEDSSNLTGNVRHGVPLAPLSVTAPVAVESGDTVLSSHRQEPLQPPQKMKRKRRPPSVPWKKPKDMPRRPLSAYNLFFKQRREDLMRTEEERQRQEEAAAAIAASGGGTSSAAATGRRKKSNRSVGIGFANLARTIASEWKSADGNTKAPYEAKAMVEKERYDQAMLVWRAKQKEEKKAVAAATSSSSAATARKPVPKNAPQGSSSAASSPLSSAAMNVVDSNEEKDMKISPDVTSSGGSSNLIVDAGSASAMSAAAVAQSMQQAMAGQVHPSIMGGGMTVVSSMHPFAMQQQQQRQQRQQHAFRHQQGGLQMSPMMMQYPLELQQHQQQPGGPLFTRTGLGGSSFLDGDFMNFPSSGMSNRMQMMAQDPNSRMAAMRGGTIDEYHHQAQSLPMLLGGSYSELFSAGGMGGGNNVDPMMEGQADQSMFHHHHHQLGVERRNTWSGMSQAQQQLFQQHQAAMLQYEQEMAEQPYQQRRRTTLDVTRGGIDVVPFPTAASSTAREMDDDGSKIPRRPLDFSVALQHGSFRTSNLQHLGLENMTTETVTNTAPAEPNATGGRMAPSSAPPQQVLAPSTSQKLFPDDWFEADTKMEDASEGGEDNVDEEPIRYSPDGDMKQKITSRTSSSASSASANSPLQQDLPWKKPLSLKDIPKLDDPIKPSGKKIAPGLSSPFQHDDVKKATSDEPLSYVQWADSAEGNLNEPLQPNQAPSLRALGMQLDEESVDFLSNLRFGGSSDHSGGSNH